MACNSPPLLNLSSRQEPRRPTQLTRQRTSASIDTTRGPEMSAAAGWTCWKPVHPALSRSGHFLESFLPLIPPLTYSVLGVCWRGRYVRILGAFYLRLVGKPIDIYQYLEPLYNDYRKLRRKQADGSESFPCSAWQLCLGLGRLCCVLHSQRQFLLHHAAQHSSSSRFLLSCAPEFTLLLLVQTMNATLQFDFVRFGPFVELPGLVLSHFLTDVSTWTSL